MKNYTNSLLTILFAFASFLSYAQTGSTTVLNETTETYAPQSENANGSWYLSGGGTLSNSSTSSADVNWTSTGDYELKYQVVVQNPPAPLGDGQLNTFVIHTWYVTVIEIDVPTITSRDRCGFVNLTHDGAQDGVVYKWRVPGSTQYTETSDELDVTEVGTYYVKGFYGDVDGTATSEYVSTIPGGPQYLESKSK